MAAKVVVTGASGHIGFHVAKELCQRGFETHLLCRRINRNVEILAHLGAKAHLVDFHVPGEWGHILRSTECVFHLAAMNTTQQKDHDRVIQSTRDLTAVVLREALRQNVPTVVYTSSVVVLGRSPSPEKLITVHDRVTFPESPYVRGKIEAEMICEGFAARGLDIRRIYPSWVVGPYDQKGTPPQRVIQQILSKGQRFIFGGGISIAAVEEVARGHVAAWLAGKPQGQYLLGGDNISFGELFRCLSDLVGRRPARIQVSKRLLLTAAKALKLAARVLGTDCPAEPGYIQALVDNYSWYDSSLAKRELGYKIPHARESLERGVRWERQRIHEIHHFVSPIMAVAHDDGGEKVKNESKLLITGVPGWLGNRFVEHFLKPTGNGKHVRRVRLLVEPRFASLLSLPANFEICAGDICDRDAVGRAVAGVGSVFHLAGAIYPPRVSTLYRVNEEGTKNLIDRCIESNVRRIVFMSTDAVCGHGTKQQRVFDQNTRYSPYRHYGKSKAAAEEYLLRKSREGAIDGTSIRGFWFFGRFAPIRQRRFLEMLSWRRQIAFGNGNNYRSVSHTDNILNAFLQAEMCPVTYSKWYWVCDPQPYSVDDVYSILCKSKGIPYRPLRIPRVACSALRAADWIMSKMGVIHPQVHAIGKFDFDIAGEPDAALRDFGYSPAVNLANNPELYLGKRTFTLPPDAAKAVA